MEDKRKFFVLTAQNGNPIPRVVNWYGKLDVKKLNRESYQELPRYVLLDMKTDTDVIYPDILTDPVLMVSAEAMEVIQMYIKKIPAIFAALFDTEKGECASYYCPILAEGEECGEALYRVEKQGRTEIRIQLELAESLLCRGAAGMELTQIC